MSPSTHLTSLFDPHIETKIMKILIVDDEKLARARLKHLVSSLINNPELYEATNGREALFTVNATRPDLVLMDIRMPVMDGLESAMHLSHMENPPSVIFTTAYDQYAIQAFKYNSIDYLLKPVNKMDFKASIEKLDHLQKDRLGHELNYARLAEMIGDSRTSFQKRIVIRYGENIKVVAIADVAYFYTEVKVNFLITFDNHRYPVDYSLEDLEHILDSSIFFRINRQFIVNFEAIDHMVAYSKSRVKLDLKPACKMETVVSTERSPVFKTWLLGNK